MEPIVWVVAPQVDYHKACAEKVRLNLHDAEAGEQGEHEDHDVAAHEKDEWVEQSLTRVGPVALKYRPCLTFYLLLFLRLGHLLDESTREPCKYDRRSNQTNQGHDAQAVGYCVVSVLEDVSPCLYKVKYC